MGLYNSAGYFIPLSTFSAPSKSPPSRYSCISRNGPIKKWVKIATTAMIYRAKEGQKPQVMLAAIASTNVTTPRRKRYLMKKLYNFIVHKDKESAAYPIIQ